MQVSFRRDLNHNYMMIENEKVTGEEYTVRMLEQNSIPELLSCQLRRMNGLVYLYYEITSRQPMTLVYEKKNMSSTDIEGLLFGIRDALESGRKYLLDIQDMVLLPEYIYMDPETRKIQLCYFPFFRDEEENSFVMLAEYILKHLDHGDARAVALGYELYRQAGEENFSLQELLKSILQDKAGQECEEQKSTAGHKGISNKAAILNGTEQDRVVHKERIRGENGAGIYGPIYKENEYGQAQERLHEETMHSQNRNSPEVEDEDFYFTELKRMREEGKKPEKEKRSKKGTRLEKRNRPEGSTWIFILCGVLAGSGLFGAAVYGFQLDLTQTGGLAFLLLAIIWIVYNVMKKKKREKKERWVDDDEITEEDYMELLREDGSMADPLQDIERNETETEQLCGETRFLTETETQVPLRLVSLAPELYPDLVVRGERSIIGKLKEQADIRLDFDSISRIHARIEHRGDDCYITDLNSKNGTFLNGERLRPNEARQAVAGDRVTFAALHYEVKG